MAQVAVFFNGVSKWQCVQIFVPCNVALFRQECSQVFGRACFQQPYYDKLFFKLVVQVPVFFNGVSKWKCVQIFVPCNVALFRQECSQVFERVTSCNRITANFVSKLWCKLRCFSTAFQNGSACKFLCPATLHFSDKSVHKFLDVLAFSNRITTNFFSNLWCKFLCFSTAFQNGSACKFLCPAKLHFFDKRVHKFLNVLAFSNRITTNFVAKFVTCCQKYETSRKKSQKNISNR